MNPIVFVMRRLVITLMLVATLAIGGVLGLSKMGVDVLPPQHMRTVHASVDVVGARAKQMKEYIVAKFESYFHKHEEESHQEQQTIVVTSPKVQDVTITDSFVCQIRAQRHIEIRALEPGYLETILIREGQVVKGPEFDLQLMSSLHDTGRIPREGKSLFVVAAVNNILCFRIFDRNGAVVVDTDERKLTKQALEIENLKKQLENLWPPRELTASGKDQVMTAVTSILGYTHGPRDGRPGELMFKIQPILYEAKLDAEKAEAEVARLKWQYADSLAQKNVVSIKEVALAKAEKLRAQAKADLAQRELNFTDVRAPFDGIADRLLQREGSLIKEGDILTTLSDNSVMWVYFNVPEKYYLEYMAHRKQHEEEDRIELVLANGDTFPQTGKIGAIEADFNNENGNIKFRADYPNPDRLLRHGQTGTIKIRRPSNNALVIPQRATFELLDKRYVWAVGDDDVAHQTLITIKHELEDIFVVDKGLNAKDKVVLEGVREVRDRQKLEYEFRKPDEALQHQKFHAE
jgi:RND family efflux transporter MFP subunit